MDIGWSSPGTDYLNRKLAQDAGVKTDSGATTQSNTPVNAPGTGATPAGGTTTPDPAQQQQAAKTANYSDPSHPPNNDPNGNWFWSNTAHQWVSGNYKYDANGKPLPAGDATVPGSAAWFKQQDQLRAQHTLGAWRPGAAAAATGGPGVDVPLYDAETQTYSYKDKDGKFTHGIAPKDIYALLNSDVQKNYPDWYFGQYAHQQDDAHRSSLDARAFDNQTFATRGGQTTRYAPTSF